MINDHQIQTVSTTTRRRIDWREVATLLARGHTVGEVAAKLDCSAAAIRRNLTRSERFRNWITLEQAGLAELSRRRLAMLMLKLPDAVEAAVEKGNATVLTWLANHLVKGELGLDTRLWDPCSREAESEEEDGPRAPEAALPAEAADVAGPSAADEDLDGDCDGGDSEHVLPAGAPLPFVHRQLLHLVDMPSTDALLRPPRPEEAPARPEAGS